MLNEKYDAIYAPPINIYRDNDDEVWKWVDEGLQKGKNILRLESAWNIAEIGMDILLGRDRTRRPNGLSTLTIKKLRRMLREQVAVQSNIRPRWGYKSPSRDEVKKKIASNFTKLLDFWWTMAFTDRRFRETIQYSGATGTGYLCLDIDKNFDGIAGNVQISANALDYRQVIPFHRQTNWNLQKLYACAIWYEMDIAEAHEKYPHAVNIIKVDRKVPSRMAKSKKSSTGFWRGVVDRVRRKKNKVIEGETPTCDIICVYVRDASVNTSGNVISMGEGDLQYDVPSFYSNEPTEFESQNGYITAVPTGKVNPDGTSVNRRITIEECKLYPNRRLIVWCSNGIIYDNGAPNLHGRFPAAPFKLDDIAGELLGYPVIIDAKSPVDSANNVLRTIEESIRKKADPDIAIDNSVPKPVVEVLKRPSLTRRVVQYSITTLAKAVVPLIPHEYNTMDANSYGFVDKLFEFADYLAGTKDTNNWSKLKQLPAGDTVEGILAATGDLPVDQSRNIEAGLLSLGPIFLGLALQIYDTNRLMQIVGAEDVAEFLDFDPTNLIPLESANDTRPKWLRAREFMRQFPFYASPNSLHERQSLTQQLKLIQMKNVGVTISDEEIYTTIVPGSDFSESQAKYWAEQEKKMEMAIKLQLKLEEIKAASSPQNQLMQGILTELAGANGEGKVGHPPSNTAAPKLESKTNADGTPRSTMTTS